MCMIYYFLGVSIKMSYEMSYNVLLKSIEEEKPEMVFFNTKLKDVKYNKEDGFLTEIVASTENGQFGVVIEIVDERQIAMDVYYRVCDAVDRINRKCTVMIHKDGLFNEKNIQQALRF